MIGKCLPCSHGVFAVPISECCWGAWGHDISNRVSAVGEWGLKASIKELSSHLQGFAQGEAGHVGVRPDGYLQLPETSQRAIIVSTTCVKLDAIETWLKASPAFALLICRFGCFTTFLGRRHLRLPTPPVCRKKATNASGRLRQSVGPPKSLQALATNSICTKWSMSKPMSDLTNADLDKMYSPVASHPEHMLPWPQIPAVHMLGLSRKAPSASVLDSVLQVGSEPECQHAKTNPLQSCR